ncbi:four-carbon acid sugar kinase family protein [Corynebacterium frankenforstense]
MSRKTLAELIEGYPANAPIPAADVRAAAAANPDEPVFVVLDDDPTGTQSVADLPVLTRWEREDLDWAFAQDAPAVYVMTNSRSLAPEDARAVNVDVARAALAAAADRGIRVAFVSRSDSTLRGHFPLEPDTLADIAAEHGEQVDGVVLVPAFGDAGRVTVGGVHFAGDAEGYVPVAETEFARDETFGYTRSDLAGWVEEKTGKAVPADDVLEIRLDTVRAGADAVAAALADVRGRRPVAVDIVTEDDLRHLSRGLIAAERAGRRFIYRVGPPFLRARIGQDVPAPLDPAAVAAARHSDGAVGGLIVVGSHVPTTTRQLARLLEADPATVVEIDVAEALGEGGAAYLAGLVDRVVAGLGCGNVVLHTSRRLVTGKDAQDSLAVARRVSDAVVEVVNSTVHRVSPRFVIAKGGITSSDVASRGLEMTRAEVVGPMQQGIISMWRPVDGPAAGVPYVVFAGNVGTDDSLAEVTATLSGN